MSQSTVWSSSPSQLTNAGWYVFGALFFWLIIPMLIALWMFWSVKTTTYALSKERLTYRRGIINRVTDEMELYRVNDHHFEQPLWLRIFGLGNIVLHTSDASHPTFKIAAIKDGERIRELIRNQVEECRMKRRVLEISNPN